MHDVTEYRSDIILGARYRDIDTGYEGIADRISFSRHACERACLVALDHVPVEHWFDAPNLERIDAGGNVLGFKPRGA